MGVCKVSVGLPVHNGERYLAEAMESVLSQRGVSLELVVSDNASTDRTPEIIRRFADTDPRVRVLRHERNLGAAANFNAVARAARGPYFRWASHDDVLRPGYLARCIELLERDPAVVVAHAGSRCIDAQGRTVGVYPHERSHREGMAAERLAGVVLEPHFCLAVFGVMRLEVLLRTPMIRPHVGSDRTLLAELALRGSIVLVEEDLFCRRDHEGASMRVFADEASRLMWFDPSATGRRPMPTWRRMAGYLDAVRRVPMDEPTRVRCLAVLSRWMGGKHHGGAENLELLRGELARATGQDR